ncbi:hypothetical protein SmJEL517_g04676 [Synchytrium microbalum]|uniref:Uncharacterized protein n=1 Tax=Synchytrium microbalum TaxID=1806994 RepID=A0A507BYG4_9FUNG|nr:uncharacterized protein SmJEL517_g04676 [Synchytrium microbalum]TPX32161.1 hypothetical protein SmJEL517_g04676 [Synchytrium microbalum]
MADYIKSGVSAIGSVWPVGKSFLTVAGSLPVQIQVVYAIYQSYIYRKTTPKGRRSAHSSVLLSILWISFGGGTIASILLNQIPAWLTIPEFIPIYLAGYVAVYWIPGVYTTLLSVAPVVEMIFDVTDGLIRGYYLTTTIEAFKASSTSASESITGQILIGVIAMTFGGLTYNWAMVPGRALTLPGFDAIMLTAGACIYILGSDYRIFDGRAVFEVLGGPKIMTKSDLTAITVLVVVLGFLNRAPAVSASVDEGGLDEALESVTETEIVASIVLEEEEEVEPEQEETRPKRGLRKRK